MYEQVTTNNVNLELFGKKVYEELSETISYFPRKFKKSDESLPVLAERTVITRKLFGYSFLKVQSELDNEGVLAKYKTE